MGIKDNYYIREIPYNEAMEIVVKNHYMHRRPPCSYSFGVFERSSKDIKGVITYGYPPSRTLQVGICGEDEADNVIELNRLWVAENSPKNLASFLVSHTIRLLPYEIIVSYADTGVGHIGYIYQATNFYYTGKSVKHIIWEIDGMDGLHARSLSHIMSLEELKQRFGDKFSYKERTQKHRYVFFNCSKKRKKELLLRLKYPILPYPKGDTHKVELNDEFVSTQMSFIDFAD